jgi:hypothetical protein
MAAMSFDTMPVWVIFAGTIVVVMGSIELGNWLGQAMYRRSYDDKDSPAGATIGPVLGLAAFMLAFTFAIVSDRYDSRKTLVREDAIALRTAWQRADFLPEADRGQAVALLRQYVDLRVAFAEQRDLEPERVRGALAETKRLQDALWSMAVANARKDMNSDVAALYIDSLNEVISIHAERVAVGIQLRVPREIWLILYCLTILGMASVGYQTGVQGAKRAIARPLMGLSFAMAFALVFALIAALDRPDSGILSVTQQPLIDLAAEMQAAADGRPR